MRGGSVAPNTSCMLAVTRLGRLVADKPWHARWHPRSRPPCCRSTRLQATWGPPVAPSDLLVGAHIFLPSSSSPPRSARLSARRSHGATAAGGDIARHPSRAQAATSTSRFSRSDVLISYLIHATEIVPALIVRLPSTPVGP